MTNFVLVHGAWHGGWCWEAGWRVILRAKGHEVYTPSLTGLAERSHLVNRNVNLETHILDIVNLLQWEELSDVGLCGHSYGGQVITGAADRSADRIGALVYLDAFVPENGQCLLDGMSAERRAMMIERAKPRSRRPIDDADPGGGISGQHRRSGLGRSHVRATPARLFRAEDRPDRRGRRDRKAHLHRGGWIFTLELHTDRGALAIE